MIRNVFGDFQITGKDYAIKIAEELNHSYFISIEPNLKTNKGVISDVLINVAGFYFIYIDEELVYIGYTNHSIRGRIGRFFAGVRGTERDDESHPAAYKFAKKYGNKCENLSLKIIPVDCDSLLSDVTMTDIEDELIYTMKPTLNNEIYRNRDVLSQSLELQ
jgi:hypothetical protein